MAVMRIPILRKIFFDRHADRIAGGVLAVLAACAIIFPRAIPVFYFILAVIAVTELLRTGNTHKLYQPPGYFWYLAGIFTLWCLATVFWSAVPMAAAGKVLFLTSTLLAAWTITQWLQTASSPMRGHIKFGLLAGIVIAAFFLLIESVFDQPIKTAFFQFFEFARPTAKHIRIENGEITHVPQYLLNRSVAVLNVLLWPAILIVVSRWQGTWRWLIFAAIAGITALTTFNSEHQSSMIAYVLGAVVFGLVYFAPRLGRISVVAGWVLAIMLVLPAIYSAYNAKLYNAEWLPTTAHARIIFWAHTAKEYTKNPIGGVGLRTTKMKDDAAREDAVLLKDHPYAMRTGRHGHNIYLQTWYELGAIGAILLLLSGLALLSRMNALGACSKPYAFATFAVAATVAAFSWGMWQVWFIAMFAFAAAAVLIAAGGMREPDDAMHRTDNAP